MLIKPALISTLVFGMTVVCNAQENKSASKPKELEVIKSYVGVWDAEIEVWSGGLDSPSIKFKGVETNRAHGEYWIASDFDSEFMGQTMRVHSIVGYDLDRKKLVGKVIDDGPYAASMTGEYDQETETVTWETKVKDPTGKPMVQKTALTRKDDRTRVLVLLVPSASGKDFKKFMQITFTKRK